ASSNDYLEAVWAELDLARAVLGSAPLVTSVYFGGGTPTLLSAGVQAAILDAIRQRFPVAANAEITTESNPESVTSMGLDILAMAGFNRISLGMQSGVHFVLQVLERKHTSWRVKKAVDNARAAGFTSVSLDLIYGTPSETLRMWKTSIETALELNPDHISAYSLTIEPGTKLANRVACGELSAKDADFQADCYQLADSVLYTAGLSAYEISNWAKAGHECQHNIGYWRCANWLGIGPGAHSHISGVRWWNVKHPQTYHKLLSSGQSPAQEREVLSDKQRRMEKLMLALRLADGLPVTELTRTEKLRMEEFVRQGLAERSGSNVRLRLYGRLLADAIIREVLD
ncbi:MAG: radical SAM family heme chaperone HemW, partial [Propionibacteriaceae bacterium]|nr:radical SAM family heme chaperone HemW [Propionibacteriaceae bacterium]